MGALIIAILIFVVMPFAIPLVMPGWKSLGVVTPLLLFGLLMWSWFSTPPTSHIDAAVVEFLRVTFASAAIIGATIKAVVLAMQRPKSPRH